MICPTSQHVQFLELDLNLPQSHSSCCLPCWVPYSSARFQSSIPECLFLVGLTMDLKFSIQMQAGSGGCVVPRCMWGLHWPVHLPRLAGDRGEQGLVGKAFSWPWSQQSSAHEMGGCLTQDTQTQEGLGRPQMYWEEWA